MGQEHAGGTAERFFFSLHRTRGGVAGTRFSSPGSHSVALALMKPLQKNLLPFSLPPALPPESRAAVGLLKVLLCSLLLAEEFSSSLKLNYSQKLSGRNKLLGLSGYIDGELC